MAEKHLDRRHNGAGSAAPRHQDRGGGEAANAAGSGLYPRRSDSDDQRNSFAAQSRYYAESISGKAEWRMVDISTPTRASPAPPPQSGRTSNA